MKKRKPRAERDNQPAMNAIARESLQMGIIHELRRYIAQNDVKPGERLPSLADMAGSMGVSQVALREALHRLDALGALNIVNGRGVFLVNPELVQLAGEKLRLDDPDVLIDIIQLRWLLEIEVVRQVIHRASDEQITSVGQLIDKLMERYQTGMTTHSEDRAFHLGLYGISNNQALFQVLSVVLRTISVVWSYPLGMSRPFYDSAPGHQEMYFAIRDRNEARAVEICQSIRDEMVASIREAAHEGNPINLETL